MGEATRRLSRNSTCITETGGPTRKSKQMQLDSGQNIQKTCCHTNDLQSDALQKLLVKKLLWMTCGEDICFEYEYLSSAGEEESSSENSPQPELQDDKRHAANIEVMSERSIILKSLLACGGLVSEWFASGLALLPAAVEAVCCRQIFLESPGQHPAFFAASASLLRRHLVSVEGLILSF